MPVGKRILHICWYGLLLGITVMILDKVFGGMTGGAKKGLSHALGV